MMKEYKPNIAILLATYNGEEFLSDQLESILSQTYTQWHIFIHDDNSSDNTVDTIKAYAKKHPEHITFFDDDISTGSAKANFSFLLEKVDPKYPYVMFADQDDIWKKDKIALTLQAMEDTEADNPNKPVLVHTDVTVTDEKLHTISNSFWKYAKLDPSKSSLPRLLMQNNITGCTVMINQALIHKALPIPEEAIMHDWWLGLVAAKFGVITWVDQPTMLYRQHQSNDTGAKPFNLSTIYRKIVSYSDKSMLHKTLQRNTEQAEKFLLQYRTELTKEEQEMLEEFSHLMQAPFLKRRMILLKYDLLKTGLIRNAGLLSRI